MKRISILFSCLLLAVTGSVLAQADPTGTAATEPAKAADSSTRTLTNVGAPGTAGQTGESRSTTVGTTGGYLAPGHPAQPSKADTDSMATTAEAEPMAVATPDTLNQDQMAADKLAADKVAADKLAADKATADQLAADKLAADNSANATTDDTLPRTASPEPAILLIGLFALAGAMFVYRRRITL